MSDSLTATNKTQDSGKVGVRLLVVFWLVVATVLLVTNQSLWLGHPFTYRHSWTSAHQATMARAFVQHGVYALRGTPLQNNLPDGAEPDKYIHWPPLTPIVISWVFRLFGESEIAAHGLMLGILLANCFALYAVVRTCFPPQVGQLAVFASLVVPVTVQYGHLVNAEPFACCGMLLALLGFIKAREAAGTASSWVVFGAASLALAVFSSWTAMLMSPGLLAIALWRRNRTEIRLGLFFNLVAALTFVGVMTLYLCNAPELAGDLWQTLAARIGLAPFQPAQFHVHTVYNQKNFLDEPHYALLELLWLSIKRLSMIGLVPTLAIVWVLLVGWKHRHGIAHGSTPLLFAGVFSPWLLWFTIMSEHAVIHDCTMQLAVPAAAVAFAVAATRFTSASFRTARTWMQYAKSWLVWIAVPVGMLVPLLLSINERRQHLLFWDDRKFDHALDIKKFTEPEAVVMEPSPSMVPVYYSKRHLIRGVLDDRLVEQVAEHLPVIFPGSPVYLALDPDDLDVFLHSMERYRLIKRTNNVLLLAISVPLGKPSAAKPEQAP